MQAEKKRAYLRTLPTGHIFPRKDLEDFLSAHNMVIPVDILISYGNRCNWLTLKGKPFKTLGAFCSSFNGVYLEKMRKNSKKKDKELLALFICTTARIINNAFENPQNFC